MAIKKFSECTHKEQIARWENAVRVLKNLTPIQRKKQWDMGFFGERTECGTVCCAAGRCGLDPWFRKRGLKLDFVLKSYDVQKDDDSEETVKLWTMADGFAYNVGTFFGDGSEDIFYNDNSRSVNKVLKEIQAHLKNLRVNQETVSYNY